MKSLDKKIESFAVEPTIPRDGKVMYDICNEPFKIYGLLSPSDDGECFKRIPTDVAEATSSGVLWLHAHAAGGRVRFATDSSYIAIHAEMPEIVRMPHFSLTGCAGFDLYASDNGIWRYIHTFVPPLDVEKGFEAEFEIPNAKMREYTIVFPLRSNLAGLYILLNENARLASCRDYKYEKPIVYYGSSITQGGCASRPGNTYQSIIARRLDCNYTNLGFAGHACAEKVLAEYIAKLSMSIFVFDYDHNAPSPAFLRETHEPMFRIIRAAQPFLPIVCISRPNYSCEDDSEERRQIILDTVKNARNAGDVNVYFVDGKAVADELSAGDSITVDTCHPNDLGFMCMANLIGREIKKILLLS